VKHLCKVLGVVLVAAFVAACANQRVPAEAALKAADDAFAPIKAEAAKYVPDQAKAVDDAMTAARDALAKGDYAAALTGAQALPAKIDELKTALAAKKDQLMVTWKDMEGGLPKMVEAITSRMDILSKSKKLPKGLDKAAFDQAKTNYEQVKTLWVEATAAGGGGDLTAAIAKGTEAKTKATEILSALGMQPPAAPGVK
jgi:hypothetical protein